MFAETESNLVRILVWFVWPRPLVSVKTEADASPLSVGLHLHVSVCVSCRKSEKRRILILKGRALCVLVVDLHSFEFSRRHGRDAGSDGRSRSYDSWSMRLDDMSRSPDHDNTDLGQNIYREAYRV
jgi:hypothetical protein